MERLGSGVHDDMVFCWLVIGGRIFNFSSIYIHVYFLKRIRQVDTDRALALFAKKEEVRTSSKDRRTDK